MAAALSARLGQLGTQQALPGRRADQGLGRREGASPWGGGGLQVRGGVTGPPPRPLRPSRPAVLWEHSPASGEDNSLIHEHTRAPARQPLLHTSLLITAGASLTRREAPGFQPPLRGGAGALALVFPSLLSGGQKLTWARPAAGAGRAGEEDPRPITWAHMEGCSPTPVTVGCCLGHLQRAGGREW